MAATENPTVDPTNLPRRIRQNHSSDDAQASSEDDAGNDGPARGTVDPWYEHDGELLFGDDTEWIRRRITQIAEANDVGSYSPRNGFRKTTKIRTKDIEEFDETLADRVEEVDEDFEFIMLPKLQKAVDIYEKGPQRTDVTFSPSFGRPAGLGGAAYYREQILAEVLCYEVEVFWDRVLQPVFEEYNEKYPY